MALRDYYVEEATTTSGTLTGPDSWAFKYINISGTRRILEAFDDDASGFVTVSEANNFTQSRPSGWRCALCYRTYELSPFIHIIHSLPRWIAYWARGNLQKTLKSRGLITSPRLEDNLHDLLLEDRENIRRNDSFVTRGLVR